LFGRRGDSIIDKIDIIDMIEQEFKLNLSKIPFGSPEEFNVVIEIPESSNLKYEYDEQSDSLKLDFIFKDLVFPFNYGFIPRTLGGDNDPLDAIVLSAKPLEAGVVIKCKSISLLKTIDRGEVDDKIVAVPLGDPLAEKYQDFDDLPQGFLKMCTDFYREVGAQKKKSMEVKSLESRAQALEEIRKSIITP
jgi:inorganic pyrophosphatase